MAAILILNKLEFEALMSKNLKIIPSTKLHIDAFKMTNPLPKCSSPNPHTSPTNRETGQKPCTGNGTGSCLHTAMGPTARHSGDHSQAV